MDVYSRSIPRKVSIYSSVLHMIQWATQFKAAAPLYVYSKSKFELTYKINCWQYTVLNTLKENIRADV